MNKPVPSKPFNLAEKQANDEAYKQAMKEQLDKERKIYERAVGLANDQENIDIKDIYKAIELAQRNLPNFRKKA